VVRHRTRTRQRLTGDLHYGLPTRYLDFSVDPLSAAFFASDNASDRENAAIYWLSMEHAIRDGAKLIFAPFWVERIYAQLGCFWTVQF